MTNDDEPSARDNANTPQTLCVCTNRSSKQPQATERQRRRRNEKNKRNKKQSETHRPLSVTKPPARFTAGQNRAAKVNAHGLAHMNAHMNTQMAFHVWNRVRVHMFAAASGHANSRGDATHEPRAECVAQSNASSRARRHATDIHARTTTALRFAQSEHTLLRVANGARARVRRTAFRAKEATRNVVVHSVPREFLSRCVSAASRHRRKAQKTSSIDLKLGMHRGIIILCNDEQARHRSDDYST